MALLAAGLAALPGFGARAADPACGLPAAPDSRWRAVWRDGKAWLLTPCGRPFFSIGVNDVSTVPPVDREPALASLANGIAGSSAMGETAAGDPASRARTLERLSGWGFNTIGAWSEPDLAGGPMPTTIDLALGMRLGYFWTDPFDPRMAAEFHRLAIDLTRRSRGKPWRIGYFSDNEAGWWNGPLFTVFAAFPPDNHTKQRLIALLHRRYGGSWEAFCGDFVPPPGAQSFAGLLASRETLQLRPGGHGIAAIREWTFVIARRYYRLAHDAIRAADPDALILGDRLPIYYDPDAVRAMAPYVDVVSTNYNLDGPDGWVARYYFDGLRRLAGRPVLVSEWFFAADENRSGNLNRTGYPQVPGEYRPSHNINRTGHLMTVATHAQRVTGALAGAARLAGRACVLGLHWFQYYDEPRGGRSDGEDYDFGLLDSAGQPYRRLTQAFAGLNPRLSALHSVAVPDEEVAPPSVIPEAAINAADNSLTDWPKARAWLPLDAAPGEVPFGDLYLCWGAQGLGLATISMDYYAPGLLAYDGAFPAGEAFRIDLGADGGAGPRRFILRVAPVPGSEAEKLRFTARLCASEDGACQPVPDAVVTYFGVALDQPRVILEARLPWRALGLAGPPRDERLRLALAVTSFYRARWMSLGGRAPEALLADPRLWREYRLARHRRAER